MKKTLLGVAVLGVALACSAAGQPNILIILADDMGYSDLGCMGSEINTPNLDRLADKGILFTQAYNTAKCYPTRASLLTGIYFQQTDKTFSHTTTLAEMLNPAGYETFWAGKHHATFDPRTRGFDRFFGFLGGANNCWNPGDAPAPGGKMPAISGVHKWILDVPEAVSPFVPDRADWFTTDVFTDKGIDWLKETKGDKNPFLLYMAYNVPHWPLQAPPEYIERCRGRYDAGYETIRNARYERQIKSGLFDPEIVKLTEPDYDAPWEALSPKQQARRIEQMEVYAAMVENMDYNIGRMVGQLRKQGQLDNTLILFLSDNGASKETPTSRVTNYSADVPVGGVDSFESYGRGWAAVGNTPLKRFKGASFEGGICTAMVAHWPKGIAAPGRVSHEPVHLIDIMPTIAELSGAQPPADLPGMSMVPMFGNKTVRREKDLFWEFNYGRAVRRGDMKLVAKGNNKWELYNMANDRSETHDLSSGMPELVQALSAAWETWWIDCTGYEFSEKKEKKEKERQKKRRKKK